MFWNVAAPVVEVGLSPPALSPSSHSLPVSLFLAPDSCARFEVAVSLFLAKIIVFVVRVALLSGSIRNE
jgi:hypothetical protein